MSCKEVVSFALLDVFLKILLPGIMKILNLELGAICVWRLILNLVTLQSVVDRTTEFRFPTASLLPRPDPSVAHPAFCSVDTGVFTLCDKVPGVQADRLSQSGIKAKNWWSYTSSPTYVIAIYAVHRGLTLLGRYCFNI